MPDTKSLSERVRKVAAKWPSYSEVGDILLSVSDALDAKEAEIKGLRAAHLAALDSKDIEIARLRRHAEHCESKMCKYCGWGYKPPCETSGAAMECKDNLDNVRRFCLRHKDAPFKPVLVRSIRGQGRDEDKDGKGKGNSYEFLEIVE